MSNPPMWGVWNRAEHYRYLAEECRGLATTTLSSKMKERYLLMAMNYVLLASIVEQAHLTEQTIEDSKCCIESSELLKARLDRAQHFKIQTDIQRRR
jgi:hypothetical protein